MKKKPFKPKDLPLEETNQIKVELINKLIKVRLKIKEFDMLLERSPVGEMAMSFFSMNESVQSTKIEGTQATFSDVIESNLTGKTNDDLQEVKNYIEALEMGKELLRTYPISTRLFHTLHNILLKNSRGANRTPGEFRRVQNFIGPTNKIEDATYIPPEPQMIDGLISNLESYINYSDDDSLDPLLKAGIIHAQFESIHPYLDGNGRLGRVLIMLYLLDSKVISHPSFFISEELEKNKFKYYSLLNDLRTDKPEWLPWLEFFLDSAYKQAEKYSEKLSQVEELYNNAVRYASDENIHISYIEAMFSKVAFTAKDMENIVGTSYNTVNKNIKKLVEGKFIYADDRKRGVSYRFYDLLDILRR
jgi:Fic family protein